MEASLPQCESAGAHLGAHRRGRAQLRRSSRRGGTDSALNDCSRGEDRRHRPRPLGAACDAECGELSGDGGGAGGPVTRLSAGDVSRQKPEPRVLTLASLLSVRASRRPAPSARRRSGAAARCSDGSWSHRMTRARAQLPWPSSAPQRQNCWAQTQAGAEG